MCAIRGSNCVYDVSSDKRRKVANQRNLRDLSEAQINLERHKQLLGGIIATIRAGSHEAALDLLATIRTGIDLPQVAAYTRNARRANPAVEAAFWSTEFVIDELKELPSLAQLLTSAQDVPPKNAFLEPASEFESEMQGNGITITHTMRGPTCRKPCPQLPPKLRLFGT